MPVWKRILTCLWALWALFCIAVAWFYFWIGFGFTQERVEEFLLAAKGCRDPILISQTISTYQGELDVCLDTNRWSTHKVNIGTQDPALWYAARAKMCKRLVDQFSDPNWCEARSLRYEAAALDLRKSRLTPLFAGVLAFAIISALLPMLAYGIVALLIVRFRIRKQGQNQAPEDTARKLADPQR